MVWRQPGGIKAQDIQRIKNKVSSTVLEDYHHQVLYTNLVKNVEKKF